MGSHSRVHYMDNLRAFAMLLGIFFHAALAYSPSLKEVWFTASPQNSVIVDFIAFFSHTFRMPLFFLIAGFFTALLIQKRGLAAMIKNRLIRITLPLVIFLPLVILSFVILIGWATESVQAKSPILGFIAMMAQYPDAPAPPVTTTHLWFLYQLTFFYFVTVVVVKFLKFDWMSRLIKMPKLFLLLGPLLLVPALMTQHAPIPAPEQFMPQLWSFGFFGLFFLFGFGLFSHQEFLDKLRPYVWVMLGVSVVAYILFFELFPRHNSMQEIMTVMATSPSIDLKQTGLATLQAYISAFMSLFLLIVGRSLFNKQNSTMKLIADSSYWIYIIHLPVLLLLQFYLLDKEWPLLVEFLLSSFGTLLIGLVSYLILVQRTPIGWLLNGKKKPSNL
ncbi:acyltransferase family protein [Paraglaciecola arctica]|uniref:Acyl transferase superfamily protein n=1 Tax=Paraglaciecola arctica BSs20135 TaxID=493475 RepID=K6YU29_9ALTE|nr:acyltransferase family protein [Paraglaciecola arctica]GAC20218.1 acyl transferase superfamily protein [Paraglaciecola arctica BSs20135]